MSEQVSSYRLEEEIAHGGMGIVYRGVHTVFDQIVAIKAIFPELTLNPDARAVHQRSQDPVPATAPQHRAAPRIPDRAG